MAVQPCIVIDRTHLGRRASGLERITRDLFSDERLTPLPVRGTGQGGGRLTTMMRQVALNPIEAAFAPRTLWVFSGFPPSPGFWAFAAHRCVLYVHDLFLIERVQDLNGAGRYYLAPNFRAALSRFRWFLVNSETTGERLARYIDSRAAVRLYRPAAQDVLNLRGTPIRADANPTVRIGMIGTIEPRKNYGAAIAIRSALETILGRPVELHVVGRQGWGPAVAALSAAPGVTLHGFVQDAEMASLVATWDLFLSTSHDEGLGLPLLEIQHAGLPVVVPDRAVFHEVLAGSGTFIDPAQPQQAASTIRTLLQTGRDRFAEAARRNIERWNGLAAKDHDDVIAFLATRLAELAKARVLA